MAKADSRRTVLEVINEVRRLLGYSAVQRLDADRYAEILLRLLNKIMTVISDKGDWEESEGTVTVTAATSVATYSLGITEPVKRIYEISFDNDKRSLDLINKELFNQYSRGSGVTGRPRFFNIKGVDSQGNPNFRVFRQPGAAEDGLLFNVEYYKAPRLYDINSIEDEIIFPANLVIQGLYAEAVLEQNGGTENREYYLAKGEFQDMLNESLNRFNADTGTDTYFYPAAHG